MVGSYGPTYATAATNAMRENGVRTLWGGFVRSTIRHIPTPTLNFGVKEYCRRHLFNMHDDYDNNNKMSMPLHSMLGSNMLAGGIAGTCTITFLHPFTTIRRHLLHFNMNDNQLKYNSRGYAYRHLVATHGIRNALYQHFGVACASLIVYRGCYFGFYDSFKYVDINSNSRSSWRISDSLPASLVLAWSGSVGARILASPWETVYRRQVMTTNLSAAGQHPSKYRSSWSCARDIMVKEGLTAFYKSAFYGSVISAITPALQLVAFDYMKATLYNQLDDTK
jgi:solute carrier family 25 (adenine nucleotide translocator) protein 4/5/6/31